MISILFFTVAWVACLAKSNEYYSYSPSVGAGSGNSFSSSAKGPITALRVWEQSHSYITGIQVCHGTKWGKIFGRKTSIELTLKLFEGEAIIQVSGKYNPSNYIYQLIVHTNKNRCLYAGLSFKTSFNFYPNHGEAELRILSGRTNGYGITALGAHWGPMDSSKENEDEKNNGKA